MTAIDEEIAPFDDFSPEIASIEAEKAVLGALLLNGDAFADVSELLRTEDFYRPTHQTIYSAVATLYGQMIPVDSITVFDMLSKTGELQKVGGGGLLFELIHGVPTTANVAHYARIVAEKAMNRRLAAYGRSVMNKAVSPGMDTANERIDWAAAKLSEVFGASPSEDLKPASDLLPGTLDEMEAIGNRSGVLSGVPTGFIDLDALLQGLQEGQSIVVAARPAVGKSTIGLDFARCAAIKHGLTSAVFSLEMGGSEIMMRMLSAEARVPLHAIRSGTMTDDHWSSISKRLGEIGGAPLYIDDSPNMSLAQIRAKCVRLKAEHGLRLVVLDYLQLMSSPEKTESRQNEVSGLSRGIKLLAKELEVPIVVISQLNRGPEQRADKRPMVSDLRESGSIEQDADVVILLHREDMYEKESPRAGEAELIVAKHRNGPTATVFVAFQGHYSRFVDMAPSSP